MDCSGNEGWIQVALPYSEVTRTLARRDPGRNMFRNWRGLDEIESDGIGSEDEEIGKSGYEYQIFCNIILEFIILDLTL